jgi:hypothetical protein
MTEEEIKDIFKECLLEVLNTLSFEVSSNEQEAALVYLEAALWKGFMNSKLFTFDENQIKYVFSRSLNDLRPDIEQMVVTHSAATELNSIAQDLLNRSKK